MTCEFLELCAVWEKKKKKKKGKYFVEKEISDPGS